MIQELQNMANRSSRKTEQAKQREEQFPGNDCFPEWKDSCSYALRACSISSTRRKEETCAVAGPCGVQNTGIKRRSVELPEGGQSRPQTKTWTSCDISIQQQQTQDRATVRLDLRKSDFQSSILPQPCCHIPLMRGHIKGTASCLLSSVVYLQCALGGGCGSAIPVKGNQQREGGRETGVQKVGIFSGMWQREVIG